MKHCLLLIALLVCLSINPGCKTLLAVGGLVASVGSTIYYITGDDEKSDGLEEAADDLVEIAGEDEAE